jgi:hypothetical protein
MILSYGVTLLGFFLVVFSMVFVVLGKKSVGEEGSPQVIKFKEFEVKTNSVLMLLIVSVVVAALPLVLLHYRPVQSCPPVSAAAPQPEKRQLYITGYVHKPDGNPFEGAEVVLSKVTPDGHPEQVSTQIAGSDGFFEMPQQLLSQGDRLKLVTTKAGYVNQTVILGVDSLNYPAVLVEQH